MGCCSVARPRSQARATLAKVDWVCKLSAHNCYCHCRSRKSLTDRCSQAPLPHSLSPLSLCRNYGVASSSSSSLSSCCCWIDICKTISGAYADSAPGVTSHRKADRRLDNRKRHVISHFRLTRRSTLSDWPLIQTTPDRMNSPCWGRRRIAVCVTMRTVASASTYVNATRRPKCDPDVAPDDYPRGTILEIAASDHHPDGSRSFQPGSCRLLTDTNTMLPYRAELTLFWFPYLEFISLALALPLSVVQIGGRPIRIAVQPDWWLCLCPF